MIASEMPLLHAGQRGLHQRQGGAEMKLAEGRDVFGRRLLDQIGPDDAGIVDDVRNGMPGRDILGRIRRRLRIEQIHQHRLELRVRPVRHAAVERDDVATGFKHRFRNGPADAAAGAGDDGGVALAHDLTRLSAPAASSATCVSTHSSEPMVVATSSFSAPRWIFCVEVSGTAGTNAT